ncbi:MAG TPA: hypothetical protein VHT96_07230 [Clostridia bacterium]|nr:hypothetical protein [Clostridia bacterium]
MNYISLLWPQDETAYSSKTKKLNNTTADDLDLDGLCNSITKTKEESETIKGIFSSMCHEQDVIRYRQEVFGDIFSSEKLRASIETIIKNLDQMKHMSKVSSAPEEATLWRLFSRFKELEGYVDCVIAIGKELQDIDIKSEGLKHLRDCVNSIAEGEDFIALSNTLKTLGLEINEIQSITLGINLDTSLNPSEVTLVSVNKTKFTYNPWFMNFFNTNPIVKSEVSDILSKIHGLSDDRKHPLMYNLYRDIESFLKPVVKDLSTGLRRYAHIQVGFLFKLIPEMTFYLCCVRLFNRLKENGMAFCKPDIAKLEDRNCIIENTYNVNLALHMLMHGEKPAEKIVLNDVIFDERGRIIIITGPNRGGKTVYTESAGLAQILFQAGTFVPGTYALMSPVDSIYSHFPVDENQTVELGRLGEEAKRLNQIFTDSTNHSLILLNESLTSTSYMEGLYISRDVIKALRYMGVRAIFNTHMHELANSADAINNEVQGESRVISFVTGMAGGSRSYRIQPGAPLGKSYAMDIAMKYGVSFEQIIDTIDKKR